MKRQTQLRGERDWAGDDLIDLQAEPLKAIDAIFAPYPACVLSGCTITPSGANFDVAPGYVSLKGADLNHKLSTFVVPFDGVIATTLPIYLTLECETISDIYGDGAMKPIAYKYSAVASTINKAGPHLELSTTSRSAFIDVLQDALHRFITDAERTKLENISAGANKYVHPDDADTRHVTDMQISDWDAKASKDVATILHDGLMSKKNVGELAAAATRSYTYCAGIVDMDMSNTELVTPLITKLKGNFTVETSLNPPDRPERHGFSYKVTHNCGGDNLPHVNYMRLLYGGEGLSPQIYNIQPDFFEVAFVGYTGSPGTDPDFPMFEFYAAAFSFTVERF